MGRWPLEFLPLCPLVSSIQKGFFRGSCWKVLGQAQNLRSRENRMNLLSNLENSREKLWLWAYLSLGATPTTASMGLWGLLRLP